MRFTYNFIISTIELLWHTLKNVINKLNIKFNTRMSRYLFYFCIQISSHTIIIIILLLWLTWLLACLHINVYIIIIIVIVFVIVIVQYIVYRLLTRINHKKINANCRFGKIIFINRCLFVYVHTCMYMHACTSIWFLSFNCTQNNL